jgi:L-alanine-DL-glutamate epimerase-like enolase superfamily enzyme
LTYGARVQITSVEAIPYRLPVARIARFASGTRDAADHVLIRVGTDAGIVGHAEAQPRPYTYGETQASIVSAVHEQLATLIVGCDPLATERVHARCATLEHNYVARAAVDLAVWDIVGKALGVTCHKLLGGYARDVAVAHMLSYDAPAAMAGEAVEYAERFGVRAFKVKVGRDVETDVAATRAVREALPEAELYVDANRGWTYDEAVRAGPALIELGIRSIEEPVDVGDRDARRRLSAQWPVPLVGDESCISLAHVARELRDGAVRTVSLKAARTGFTESRRILGFCAGMGTPVVVGSQYEGALGVMATAALAPAFAATAGGAAEVMNFTDLADDILAGEIVVRDGRLAPPDAPGLGIAIDEDKLAHYRLDRDQVATFA